MGIGNLLCFGTIDHGLLEFFIISQLINVLEFWDESLIVKVMV